MRFKTIAILSAAALLRGTPANAALVVTSNLGSIGLGGTLNVTGDSSTGANNADFYDGEAITSNWLNEIVFEFTVTQSGTLSITSAIMGLGDVDFFLLNDLTTGMDGGRNVATPLSRAFLDNAPPETLSLGNVTPGTYYLSVDAFEGGDSIFDVDLSLTPIPEPSSILLLGMGLASVLRRRR
jgi:hypothetical protein